jgi:hypothetical protein
MSREHFGWVIWASWLIIFLALEIPAAFWKNCPWPTFSTTTFSLQARWDFLTIPVVAILAILASHLIRFQSIQASELHKKAKERAGAKMATKGLNLLMDGDEQSTP